MSKNCNVWHRKPRPTKKLRHCAPCFTTRCKRGWDFDRCFAGLRGQLCIEFQHVRNAFWGGEERRGGRGPVDSCWDSLVHLFAASILILFTASILFHVSSFLHDTMWAAEMWKRLSREDLKRSQAQEPGVRLGELKTWRTQNRKLLYYFTCGESTGSFVQTCFRRLFRIALRRIKIRKHYYFEFILFIHSFIQP